MPITIVAFVFIYVKTNKIVKYPIGFSFFV